MTQHIIKVKVVPNSSEDRVIGIVGDALKIKVSVPPEDGKANTRVIEILAKHYNIHKNNIQLLHGASNPNKTFQVNH